MNKKNDVILSIGLIVKNEEEHLARCLDSLKPIMEALPCQLIITDTGSTDSTMEIAQKYTKEIYEFEWCDDFAAARNFGLEKAKGQWFMFIDADEWFEDCKDLIDFFKTGEYKNYKNATYIARNYVNSKDKNNFEDHALGRLFQNRDNMKFKGSIHESIDMCLPIKELKSHVNHYGYAIDNSKEFRASKADRNLKLLLKEFENEPDNDRWAYLLSKEYASSQNKAKYRQLIRKVYDKTRDNYENDYLPYFVYQLALIFKDEGVPDKGIEILKKYKKSQKKKEVWNLDILAALVDLSINVKSFNEAIKYGEEYFRLFHSLKKGKLETGISGIVTKVTFINEESAVTITNLMAQAYLYKEENQKAVDTVMELDFNIIIREDLKDIFKIVFYAAFAEARWGLIPELYVKVLNLQNSEKVKMFGEMLEEKIMTDLAAYENVASAFNEYGELQESFEEDNYVMLQNLRFSMIEGDNDYTSNIVEQFLQRNTEEIISPIFAEFVLFALSIEKYTNKIIDKIDIEDLHLYTHKLNNMYTNLGQMFVNVLPGYSFIFSITDRKAQFWVICLMEIILVRNASKSNVEAKEISELFSIYLEKSYNYMKEFYNESILQDENVTLLPRSYRFIYYAYKAYLMKSKGDYMQYVKLLKQAISQYPVMASVVKILIDDIDIESESVQTIKEVENIEFKFYARAIKEKIKEIAKSGMQNEAIELLNSYKKVNPEDKLGIIELERVLEIDN